VKERVIWPETEEPSDKQTEDRGAHQITKQIAPPQWLARHAGNEHQHKANGYDRPLMTSCPVTAATSTSLRRPFGAASPAEIIHGVTIAYRRAPFS
jgi:hypothetical protein